MAIAPQFGQGRTVAVKPQEVEGGKKKFPTWAWYAGGAVIGFGIILLLRGQSTSGTSTGTATGTPLIGTPTSDAAQIGNLTAAIQGITANGVPTQQSAGDQYTVVRGLNGGAYVSQTGTGNFTDLGGQFANDVFQVGQNSQGQTMLTGVGLNGSPYTNTLNGQTNTWQGWTQAPGGGLVKP